MSDNKIIEKVKKLLALGTSSSEAEASSAIEKAHALLAEHNLSLSDVKETGDILEETLEEGKRIPSWKKMLITSVARANYCDALQRTTMVWSGKSYSSLKKVALIGKAHNLVVAKAMVEYLFDAIERLSKNNSPSRQGKGKNPYIESYKLGATSNICKRLHEIAEAEQKPESGMSGLVAYEKAEIQNFLKDLGSKKTSIKSKVSSAQAYNKGFIDGQSVGLHRQVAQESQQPRGYFLH